MRLALFLFVMLLSALPAMAAKNILVMGDSLSAGYGIRPEQAWPSLLAKRLSEQGSDYSVVNLSISGETSAGGLSRLTPALQQHKPAVVIIVLGANDGLRGLPLSQMQDNLGKMVDASRRAGARILLIGMRLPPNYGIYAQQFQHSFDQLAQSRKTALLPFLLEPVAAQSTFFQADNLHPTAEAQPLLLNHLWPTLRPLLK